MSPISSKGRFAFRTSPTRKRARVGTAIHHAMATGKGRSVCRSIRAEAAHRVLDGEHDSAEVPRRDPRGCADVEQGVREDRLHSCDLARGAIADAAFAFDVLAARGLDPGGPEADDFVRGFLRYVSAHE